MALSASVVKQHGPPAVHGGLYIFTIDITLDGSFVADGWTSLESVTGMPGFNLIQNLVPPANKGGYSFEFDQVNRTLVALQPASESFREAAIAEFTQYPAFTATEQGAAFAKVLDGTAYLNLAVSAGGAGYTANYQLLPDTPVAGDAFYFGAAAKFCTIGIDMSATVMVYDEANCLVWEFYDGDAEAWVALTSYIDVDNSGSTGVLGDYFGEQDGVMIFDAPEAWGLVTIDSQSAYWIRAVVQTDKADNITTSGLTNSTEHDLNIPTTGYVPTRTGTISSVSIHDQAGTLHTANDIVLVLMNTTTGRTSGKFSFAQDLEFEKIPLPKALPATIGDKLAIYCSTEDGTNEAGPITLGFNYGAAQAPANDKGLEGLVLRCEVNGYC